MFGVRAVTGPSGALAMNFLMDRDAEHWARDLAALKSEVGSVRDGGADHCHRRAVGRVHLAVRAGPRSRVGAARADRAPQIQALSLAAS